MIDWAQFEVEQRRILRARRLDEERRRRARRDGESAHTHATRMRCLQHEYPHKRHPWCNCPWCTETRWTGGDILDRVEGREWRGDPLTERERQTVRWQLRRAAERFHASCGALAELDDGRPWPDAIDPDTWMTEENQRDFDEMGVTRTTATASEISATQA